MDSQFILLTLIILIVNIYRIIKITKQTGFNSVKKTLRNEFEGVFQLDSSYLSTEIFDFAVPFYMETERNDQRFGHFSTMIMLLRYFRRRSSVVPCRNTDVNDGRYSSSTDCTRVVSLRRVRVFDNIAADLYNALLRDIPRQLNNRHNCMFCRAIYQNNTPYRSLAQIRQWLQLTIPDGMERHTYAQIRQWLQLAIPDGMERHTDAQIRQWLQLAIPDGMEGHTDAHIRQFLLREISNARPHHFCCQGQRMRNLWISTQRLTFLFPYNRFHDNRLVTFDSPSFLVRGLRLCLRVYPNGIGDGHISHMSVFLVLADTQMLSYNDRRFPLAIRVTLVANQRRYINMAYTVVVRNPRSWYLSQSSYVNEFGFEMFASRHLLEHCFIRDGVVTFIIALDD